MEREKVSEDIDTETIFALSTGQPPAAIAIVRVSGPEAAAAQRALCGVNTLPRHAAFVTLRDPDNGMELDNALTLFFPGPNSATGEDLVEFHLHGGRAVVAAVERALAGQRGLRAARPGEFTRRAFANGRLDLAEAEGLGDLLMAETEGQRRNAIALAGGALSRAVRQWRIELIDAAAAIEARIDFADEDDVPSDDGDGAIVVQRIRGEIETLLRVPPAERLKDGIRVVLAGPPNSGKSSLFNALVGRDAAITAPVPGTTRDIIEFPITLGGLPFVLVDTAGLRETSDEIEEAGVNRATTAIATADMVLWLGEPEESPPSAIAVHARCDLPERSKTPAACEMAVSAMTGRGLPALNAMLVSRGTSLLPRENEIALAKRQRDALGECLAALSEETSGDIVLAAENLRAARAALDQLTGEGGVEPLLDAIFGRFCIGK